jgi:hypothetical protein
VDSFGSATHMEAKLARPAGCCGRGVGVFHVARLLLLALLVAGLVDCAWGVALAVSVFRSLGYWGVQARSDPSNPWTVCKAIGGSYPYISWWCTNESPRSLLMLSRLAAGPACGVIALALCDGALRGLAELRQLLPHVADAALRAVRRRR